jgi:HAD superfamily hydrolase (TIGR01509 family)
MNAIDAVVFDLDGLLVDSEPLQLRAWETYLERFKRALTDEMLSRMYGLRMVDSAELVARELALPVAPADVVRDRDALFLATVPGNVFAMPGAVELLAALRERSIRTALATSGHRRYVDLALESAGLVGAFDVEVTGDLVAKGKPAPDTYLRAAELFGLPPGSCLALEDAPNGVTSAHSAGMRCFAIPNHGTRHYAFDGADAVLTSLSEVVPELLRRGWLSAPDLSTNH